MSVNNIVRYPAKQGNFSATQTLVDVEIPSGSGKWDLSKCYIDIPVRPTYTETTAGAPVGQPGGNEPSGVYSNVLIVDVDGNSTTRSLLCPPTQAILVKNAECFSSTKGRIASARRVDALRTALAVYEKDEREAIDDVAGINRPATDNIWSLGKMAELSGEGEDPSIERSHGVKIYLKDVFNFGEMNAYDSSPNAMGALRIHLETNLDLLKSVPIVDAATYALNQEADGGNPTYGAIDAYANPGVPGQALTYAMTTAKYVSVEDAPWWVGQKCLITNNGAGGAGNVANAIVKIKKITHNDGVDVTKNPTSAGAAAGNLGKLFIEFDTVGYAAALTNGQSRAAGTLVHTPSNANTLSFDKIDLVAASTGNAAPPNAFVYSEWLLQDDALAAGVHSNYTRTYQIPANCITGVILHCGVKPANGASMYSSDEWKTYRVSINNEPLTTLDVQAGSTQHFDLIRKAFVNRGKELKCLEEKVQSIEGRRVGGGRAQNGRSRIIAFPVPLSSSPQQLELGVVHATGTFAGPVRIFWEIMKSV